MTKVFKIQHKTSKKFWNGEVHRSSFVEEGKAWKKQQSAENHIAFFMRYHSRFKKADALKDIENWQIVGVEVTHTVTDTYELESFLEHCRIRKELQEVSVNFSSFLEVMRNKGVADKIQYIFELQPSEGRSWVDRDRIVEARSELRGLGIKTRTFREYRGMFGFMDRQQALRARLSLHVKRTVDLSEYRKPII